MTVVAGITAPTLSAFGHDPWWLIAGKTVVIFGFLVMTTLFMIWAERRVVARMQQRLGPNRVGPFGLLQGLADGIKLALKEDIVPLIVDKPVYLLAPVLSAIPAFLAFAVIPIGPEVSIFGHRTPLQLTDLPVAVLYVLAASSIGVYGIVLAGWSSGSTYPLLGALRSTAQVISYEVAMALALVPVFLYAGSLSTSQIVQAQDSFWFVVTLFPSFVLYVIAAVGETNRAPFDLPEAEGELVGGFHTEYSSLKFAMFFLAEYINMTTVSALATTLFLGGWHAPFLLSRLPVLGSAWFGIVWFLVKLFALLFGFIWLRGTLPRLRYDQFMRLGWTRLIPFSLVWLLIVGAVRTLAVENINARPALIVVAVILGLLLVVSWIIPQRRTGRSEDGEAAEGSTADALGVPAHEPAQIAVGDRAYPVPLLPGEEPAGVPREVSGAELA